MRTRGVAVVIGAALLATGPTACGDGGDGPAATKTSTATAPPQGSSTSASNTSGTGRVAPLPPAATRRTEAGAIAFNEFFELQMGEALKTGDTATLRAYSSSCAACDEYIRITDDNAAKGTTMNINPNTVRDLSATKRSDGGYRVTLTVDADTYHEVHSDGSLGREAAAVSYTLVTDTQWEDGHWVIRDSVRTG